jgi:deoxyadenosine/deoxycytidine kinase
METLEYIYLAVFIFITVAILFRKLYQFYTNDLIIRVISVDGCIGAGKTTLLRHLASGASKQFHDIIGAYYINEQKQYLLVEEPLHLYQRNGLLKSSLMKSNNSMDIFQVSVMHLMHVHMQNVLELAMTLKLKVIIIERHIETVRHTFMDGVIEKYPDVEMNLLTGYQIAQEDLIGRYAKNLADKKLLHGCIYVDWADAKTLTDNIIRRGREMETQLIHEGDTYVVNNWLDKKYREMLEIINVPVYYISEKFGEGQEMSHLKIKIDNYIDNI